ncbi:hypothetical protein B0H17DRAFT_1003772 [Mycena rosella]|uniref:SWIM-type domain-containing protein n=1 Tax=Mycena rosella TaxID=1033263 RepID=A0AAD7E297_MYCRO|nr:hypothetical protein B0H17DRAFT_1003772 [Mycena rosella]
MSALSCYAESVIVSLGAEHLTDHSLLNLQAIFPRNLVLAALDLIDRQTVLKCIGPARHHYEVLGSTAIYRVFLNLPGPISTYCTCPAFTYLVLSSESHLMCKHILATRLAVQMARCVERPLSEDELASMIMQEYS